MGKKNFQKHVVIDYSGRHVRLLLDRLRAKLQPRKFCKFNHNMSRETFPQRIVTIIEDRLLLGKANMRKKRTIEADFRDIGISQRIYELT